ncbi:hypothetical protein G3576_30200 [Roseomonas stagni]|uniref:Uncharacterized protein n=1 Tax=Falsiroseomonas algicola TaxID=2716930 RepID=A0A6M1LUZ8_9PROT|nr:hypothetical protein [Falsiroseomonas algicola]NGM24300.1 hypothetical protein [Falsiroseomonas algicola]
MLILVAFSEPCMGGLRCKMAVRNIETQSASSSLEEEIAARIAEVERRIYELTQERETLGRLLLKARQSRPGVRDVTRRNSVSRILIEQQIVALLKNRQKPASVAQLFKAARSADPNLKEGTFRSYLHRLFEKGLVQKAGRRGYWIHP